MDLIAEQHVGNLGNTALVIRPPANVHPSRAFMRDHGVSQCFGCPRHEQRRSYQHGSGSLVDDLIAPKT